MPDRLVRAGMLNYAVRPASTVRFFATARGTKEDGSLPTATELWKTLAGAGFGANLVLLCARHGASRRLALRARGGRASHATRGDSRFSR